MKAADDNSLFVSYVCQSADQTLHVLQNGTGSEPAELRDIPISKENEFHYLLSLSKDQNCISSDYSEHFAVESSSEERLTRLCDKCYVRVEEDLHRPPENAYILSPSAYYDPIWISLMIVVSLVDFCVQFCTRDLVGYAQEFLFSLSALLLALGAFRVQYYAERNTLPVCLAANLPLTTLPLAAAMSWPWAAAEVGGGRLRRREIVAALAIYGAALATDVATFLLQWRAADETCSNQALERERFLAKVALGLLWTVCVWFARIRSISVKKTLIGLYFTLLSLQLAAYGLSIYLEVAHFAYDYLFRMFVVHYFGVVVAFLERKRRAAPATGAMDGTGSELNRLTREDNSSEGAEDNLAGLERQRIQNDTATTETQ